MPSIWRERRSLTRDVRLIIEPFPRSPSPRAMRVKCTPLPCFHFVSRVLPKVVSFNFVKGI